MINGRAIKALYPLIPGRQRKKMNRQELIERLGIMNLSEEEPPTEWLYNLVAANIFEGKRECYNYGKRGVWAEENKLEELLDFDKDSFQVTNQFSPIEDNKMVKSFTLTSATSFVKINNNIENITVFAFSTNKEKLLELSAFCKKNINKRQKDNLHIIGKSRSGLTLKKIGNASKLLIKENYTPSVIESFEYVVDEYSKAEPAGRITILNGPPGTGKSYFVRGLMEQLTNCTTILLPSRYVAEVDGPDLVDLFLEEKNSWRYMFDEFDHSTIRKQSILLIIEDADQCLVPRGSDNISTISSLLNCTDGIYGEAFNLKIIATTNQKKISMDEALMRPGRLCRSIEIGKLDPKTAEEVYERIAKKKRAYTTEVSLAQVYADAKGVNLGDIAKKGAVMGFGNG
jgi:hypothetical protein